MKCIVILFCVLAATQAIAPEAIEKMKAKVLKNANECKSELGVNEDDIAPILAHHPPTSNKGKCFVACMNKKIGFQDANGKISKDGAYAAIEEFKDDDEELYEKSKKIADACVAEVSDTSDECETAYNILLCVNKQKEALGIEHIEYVSK